jgi:hypothetical protein
MHGREFFDRLNFNDDKVVNDEIHAKTRIEMNVFVCNRRRHLTTDSGAAKAEFMNQTKLINRLQKTRTQRHVNRISGLHHLAAGAILFRGRLKHLGSFAPWRFKNRLAVPLD